MKLPIPLLMLSVGLLPVGLSGQILIDFGNPDAALVSDPSRYNNITTSSGSWNISDLVDMNGSQAGMSLTFSFPGSLVTKSEGISGLDQDGFTWDTTATKDSLYTTSYTDLMSMTLTGLEDGHDYQFAFFGDRNAYATFRPTEYSVTIGSVTETDSINITHNGDSGPASIALVSITADATGVATITVGARSDNADGQYHINVMQITDLTSAVPEVSTYTALLGLASLLVVFRRRLSRRP